MPLKAPRDEEPQLNLTSMIDVIFLLIVFFMMSSRFVDDEHTMAVKVPQVAETGSLAPAPDKRVINVYSDGRIVLDRQTLSIEQLASELTAAHREYDRLGVIVRGDGDAPLQQVANVLSACRQAGISDMGISVRLQR